jgi:hypothetical protein
MGRKRLWHACGMLVACLWHASNKFGISNIIKKYVFYNNYKTLYIRHLPMIGNFGIGLILPQKLGAL